MLGRRNIARGAGHRARPVPQTPLTLPDRPPPRKHLTTRTQTAAPLLLPRRAGRVDVLSPVGWTGCSGPVTLESSGGNRLDWYSWRSNRRDGAGVAGSGRADPDAGS